MKHHTLPEISGLLLLISTPLCYSVSLPTGQPQPNMFYYNCYYIFWAQRKTALAICVHHTSKDICIQKKIFVLNVLFIVEIFENKYYTCILYISRLVWRGFSRRGLSSARLGRMSSNPANRGCPLTPCGSATLISRWCIITESSSEGCHILHFGRTTSLVCGCSCNRQRPWHSVIWHPRFRPARFQHAMLAPPRKTRRWMRPTRVRDEPVSVESPTMTVQDIPDLTGTIIYDVVHRSCQCHFG